jgi:hypothetical protein
MLTQTDPPTEATHWTATVMAKAWRGRKRRRRPAVAARRRRFRIARRGLVAGPTTRRRPWMEKWAFRQLKAESRSPSGTPAFIDCLARSAILNLRAPGWVPGAATTPVIGAIIRRLPS